MNQSNEEFLQSLERRAKQSEAKFLDHIAAKLGRPRVTTAPQHPYRGAPDFWLHKTATRDECIEQFMHNWRQAGGKAIRCMTLQEAGAYTVELMQEEQCTKILLQQQPEIVELAEHSISSRLPDAELTYWGDHANMLEAAAQSDLGLILADYAVAFTGSVVQLSASNKGRATSLLPPKMIVIIPEEVIVMKLGEVMEKLEQLPSTEVPAGIHFISGPSRSADIENDLTIGVHGPGEVHAIIVG